MQSERPLCQRTKSESSRKPFERNKVGETPQRETIPKKKVVSFCRLFVANASKEYNQEEISSLQPGALLLVESIRMKGVHYKE